MTISPRIKFVAMFALFALPIIASYLTFFFWSPTTTNNFGTLITPVVALPAERLTIVDGQDAPRGAGDNALRGKWLMLTVDDGGCFDQCQKKAYTMRQARQILGREQERVARVVLQSDGGTPTEKNLSAFAGTAWVQARGSAWPRTLPLLNGSPEAANAYIYAVDPMGNVFMRYRADVDIKHLVADFKRVLKASQLGKDFEGKIDSVTK